MGKRKSPVFDNDGPTNENQQKIKKDPLIIIDAMKKQIKTEPVILIDETIIKTPKEPIFKLPAITQPEYKTNYVNSNGFKYAEIPITSISDSNNDYAQYFDSKQCCILKG